MITSYANYRISLAEGFRRIALRDGAQMVDVLHPLDGAAATLVVEHGVTTLKIACCGPAAPYPESPRDLDRCAAHLTPACLTCWPCS